MPEVDIGDARLHYEAFGRGSPVLLVPGLSGRGAFWMQQVPALAERFQVIIHDHRGCGESTHSEIEYSVEQMAADALALMDGLGLERVHYVGHSTGGAMGQIIAQDRPERLASLVLSATWAGPDPYFRRCFALRREVLRRLGRKWYERAGTLSLLPPWWIAEHDAQLDQTARIPGGPSPVPVMLSRIDAITAFDRRARMGDVRAPTLVICAADDAVTPLYLSEELAAGIPRAESVVLPRGGHFAPVVAPDSYNPPLLAFLARA